MRGALVVPALCVAIPSVGPETGTSHGPVAVGVAVGQTTSASAQAVPETSAADEPVEDLVHVSVADRTSGPPASASWSRHPRTRQRPAAVVRVRTTVLNESAAPYEVCAVLGPTAGYDGRDVPRIADSRFAAPTAEHIVPPGRRTGLRDDVPGRDRSADPAVPGRFPVRGRGGRRSRASPARPEFSCGCKKGCRDAWTSRTRRSTGRPAARAVPGGGDDRGGDGVPGRAGVGVGVRRGERQREQRVDGPGDRAVAADLDDHGLGREPDRVPVRPEPGPGPVGSDLAGDEGGDRGDRGPAVLPASGGGLAGHDPGGGGELGVG